MLNMAKKRGNLTINSENIFPIIKKWMYSDHDIFIRELVSNGCDAITKLKKLDMMGEYQLADDYKGKIQLIVDDKKKTLKFIDNGVGMTADEVEEYITQIAFSGATQFLEKYKDKTSEDEMIGHFGLGFYSAFMVADEVHIDTLSYKEGATPVHWTCDGGTEYDMEEGTKDTVGTEITLFLNDNNYAFSNEYRVREVVDKYCSFMPTEIYLSKADEEVKEGEAKEEPKPLNDTTPLWTKHPNECEKDEYIEFYRKVFMDYKEPLFWIHLNMDYPFNLKGILYFPKINTEYDSAEGKIKLYNNQVFIADNIKEVIPEFLMVLKGVIDCPDLPLNVSRSALQNDGFVNKISDYISRKVADKLSGMCKTDKENYEKYWDDISPFIKFGCLKDTKFCDKMSDYILFKNLDHKYLTLKECLENGKLAVEAKEEKQEEVVENAETENKDEKKKKVTIYYVTDEQQQSQYINMFKEEGLDAVILTHNIDNPFISQLEQRNEELRFQRIDADLTENFKQEEVAQADVEALTEIFKKALEKENLSIKVENLKNESVASMMTLSEESRRMQEMMRMYGMPDMPGMENGMTLVLNAKHPLVQYVLEHKDGDYTTLFCKQLYDLALLGNKPLSSEELTAFITRNNEIMMLLTK